MGKYGWSSHHSHKVYFIRQNNCNCISLHKLEHSFHKLEHFNGYLFTLPGLILLCQFHCSSSTPVEHRYIFLFLLSALQLPLTNQSRELHLLHFSLLWWHLDLPLLSDLTMTVSFSFYPFVDSFTWRLFLRLKRKVIDNDWMLHRFILLLDQHYPMQKLSQQSLKCWYQTKTV